jgi:cysteine-rich repeat protein
VQACGDGSLDFLDGEECDDGNVVSGDGCSAFCTLEPEPMCGDGQQDTGEQCDDGNLIDGDGCSAQCEIELPVCGNGLVEAGEQCDDGNTNNGDGCDASCLIENTGAIVPAFQFNVGDSIGEAQSADGVLGSINHRSVWSTGYDNGDIVTTLNERFESSNPEAYLENNSVRDPTFNKAISGSTMADFASQAQRVREEVATLGASGPGQVTVLLGGNDVCAPSMDTCPLFPPSIGSGPLMLKIGGDGVPRSSGHLYLARILSMLRHRATSATIFKSNGSVMIARLPPLVTIRTSSIQTMVRTASVVKSFIDEFVMITIPGSKQSLMSIGPRVCCRMHSTLIFLRLGLSSVIRAVEIAFTPAWRARLCWQGKNIVALNSGREMQHASKG